MQSGDFPTTNAETGVPGVFGCSIPAPVARVVLLHCPSGVPEAWTQGVADLLAMPCPASCPEARWNVVREDAYRFLRDHAARAHELGWTALNLFGVHPEKPWVPQAREGHQPHRDRT